MGKSGKKAAAVVAAEVPKGKAGNKREAVDEIEKAVSAKKTKAAPPAKAVPPPKEEGEKDKKQLPPKEESSTSEEEADPEEEISEEESGSEEEAGSEEESGSESEEEVKEQTKEAAEPVEQESSDGGSDVSSESNEDAEPASAAKIEKKDSSNDDSDSLEDDEEGDSDDESDEEETPKPKTPQATGCKTLFMGNAPFNAEFDEVKEFFKEAGEVIDVRFPLLENGRRKGFGYVEFATVEAAQKAIELNDREFMSRTVRLDFAAERGTYTPRSGNDTGSFQKPDRGSNSSVFIRGFDKSLPEDKIRSSLEQHFAQCGEITRISVPTDKETGAIKGIAYMDFKDQDSLSKALALKGSDLGGCELFVDQANPRGDSRGSFGGRSGGRFGGGSGGRFGGRSGGKFGGRSGGRFGGGSGGRRGGGRGGRGGRGFAN